jgi:hypothetical protein
MSDPRKEQLFERLDPRKIAAEPAGAGAVCILLPGLCQVTLTRDEAITFSQGLITAIAQGEPTWEGWS